MGRAILVPNSQLTRTLSYICRIHCRQVSCVLAVLNNCRVITGSLRVTYGLLRYSTIFMQRYGGIITTSLRVFSTTVRQCASFCEFPSSLFEFGRDQLNAWYPFINEHQMFPLSSIGTREVLMVPETFSLACSM